MPIHEGIAAALGGMGATLGNIGGSVQQLSSRLLSRAPAFAVARIIWPLGRTIGLLSNQIDPGRKTIMEAVTSGDWWSITERALKNPPLSPYGMMGLGLDFWRGAAFPNFVEMAEAWLTTTGELFVPGTDTRRFFEAAARGDVTGLINPGLDRMFESLGLEDVTAFMGGVDELVGSVGLGQPFEAMAGAISGFYVWLDNGVRFLGEKLGLIPGEDPDLPDPGRPRPKAKPPPEMGEPDLEGGEVVVGGAGDDEFEEVFIDFLSAALSRISEPPASGQNAAILQELKKIGLTTDEGFGKLLRVVRGLFQGQKRDALKFPAPKPIAPRPPGFPPGLPLPPDQPPGTGRPGARPI